MSRYRQRHRLPSLSRGFQLASEVEGCILFVMTRRNEEVIEEGKEKKLFIILFCMILTNQI